MSEQLNPENGEAAAVRAEVKMGLDLLEKQANEIIDEFGISHSDFGDAFFDALARFQKLSSDVIFGLDKKQIDVANEKLVEAKVAAEEAMHFLRELRKKLKGLKPNGEQEVKKPTGEPD